MQVDLDNCCLYLWLRTFSQGMAHIFVTVTYIYRKQPSLNKYNRKHLTLTHLCQMESSISNLRDVSFVLQFTGCLVSVKEIPVIMQTV